MDSSSDEDPDSYPNYELNTSSMSDFKRAQLSVKHPGRARGSYQTAPGTRPEGKYSSAVKQNAKLNTASASNVKSKNGYLFLKKNKQVQDKYADEGAAPQKHASFEVREPNPRSHTTNNIEP
jgi:hypothetical protein